MKGKAKISELQDNSEAQIFLKTRVKGHFWRDEIDFEGIFHFMASSVVDCSSVFDDSFWRDKFIKFENLGGTLSLDDYAATRNILIDSFSVFRHQSIHILKKAWEFFSSGGDTYAQAEITCKGRTYKKSRIFVCKNYYIGTGVFILDGDEWSNHESIFMNKTLELKVTEIQFSNLLDIINTTTYAGSLCSNKILTGFIEKNFNDKIPSELLDIHLMHSIKTAKQQDLDDVFGEQDKS
jgi:hypothetical protein